MSSGLNRWFELGSNWLLPLQPSGYSFRVHKHGNSRYLHASRCFCFVATGWLLQMLEKLLFLIEDSLKEGSDGPSFFAQIQEL